MAATTWRHRLRWLLAAGRPANRRSWRGAWPNAGIETFRDATMTTTQQNDIRGVLIAVAGARLLLPNATIAEVLSFAPPDAIEGAPEWLLGRIRWRGWQLPLIAFSRMAGLASELGGLGSKVVVLKSLGGDS